MSAALLRRVAPEAVGALALEPVDAETLAAAGVIVDQVKREGEAGLRALGERFGDRAPDDPLIIPRPQLLEALEALPTEARQVLERAAAQIRGFAEAQKAALSEITVPVPGGFAGHTIAAVERAGCYAPGGRFPLPSSVLMTALVARVAGVREVWVASPRPAPITLAAAALAGADGLLAVGGAQAIAAMAYGAGEVPACDAIVGPGNRWVTAAKQLVSGRVAIDMLAGPSELLVLADDGADPATIAADLLAQAEHDVDARPILISTSATLPSRVDQALRAQLETLPTAETARRALTRGFCVVVEDLDQAIQLCDQLAPEHLELLVEGAPDVAPRLSHYGALFIGPHAAEVLGDYGAGPNHVLPTGGTARFTGGLSVLTFLRVRTWLRIDDPAAAQGLIRDAAALARLEGLEGHARAAERRLTRPLVKGAS